MSVYLNGSSVLLNGGKVATSTVCCCGGGDCCPLLDPFTTITFAGQVLGCDGGTVTLPTKVWTRVAGGPGCDLALYEWSIGSNCGCQFQAQNCFPFTETDQIAIDQTGNCDDPDFGSCILDVEFFCNDGTVLLTGSATAFPCCPPTGGEDGTPHGPYDITSGSLDITYASDTNPAISFHYIITLA